MTNAKKFEQIFGLHAVEVWSMPETDFAAWMNIDSRPERKEAEWIESETGQVFCPLCGSLYLEVFCAECGTYIRGVENETD